MKRILKGCAAAAGIAAMALMGTSPAMAAEWPNDNVRLVVPYSAGGTTDIVSRKVADLLQQELGENVIVENRSGAGSTIATGMLARGGRNADHSILMASPGHTIGPAIYPGLPYDPIESFRFIRNVITIPNVMVVPADSPFDTMGEFIEAAQSEEQSFSSSGVGSSIHMSGELFKTLTGSKMVHVPFRGSGEALPALLSGDVDVSFENMPTVLPHIRDGKLKALAVTTTERSPFLPDVPTVQEEAGDYGLEDFQTSAWFGLIAHKDLPDNAVDTLQQALDQVIESESFQNFLPQLGAEAGQAEGEEFRQLVADELEKWAGLTREAEISR